MQPSANWGVDGIYNAGINARSGAVITDPDYSTYPPFVYGIDANAPESKELFAWYLASNTFSINTPIDDWSIAYTAVDNTELSLNNIGVFLADPDTPEYVTNNSEHQNIVFYSSILYNLVRTTYNMPSVGSYNRFYGLPYSNNYFNWSPDCHSNTYEGVPYYFLHDVNVHGYAAIFKSFGIKSIFLEIHVKPYHLQGTVISPDLTLQEYASLPQQTRDDNPIGAAYARVYRRANTSGDYIGDSEGYCELQAVNTLGLSDGTHIIYNYFSGVQIQSANPKIILPLWGFANAGMASTGTYISYTDSSNAGDLFYGYDKIDGSVLDQSTGYYYCYKYMNGTDANIEYLRRCCAAYGLFFCDNKLTSELDDLSGSSTENTRWTNDEMMLGIIEPDGYTRGRYSHGADNANQPQFNWTDSTESTYDPSIPPTPTENEYDTHTVFNTISDTATLFKRYVLNDSNVRQLGLDLFDVCDDIAGDDPNEPYKNYAAKINSNFLTNNPIDCIISLQRFPMSIPKDDNTPENIKLGRVSVNAIGYETTQTNYEYSFTSKTIFPCFGDSFLDYNPYTTYELYIPFCGTVRLDPADILYRKLNVYLNVDFSTGTCTGYVLSDNLVIETVSGNIAIDIPVTGISSATVNANLNNAIVAYQNSKIKQIENIAGTIGYGIKAGAGVMKFAATGDTDNLAFGGGFRQIMDNVRGNIGGDKANYDLQHQIVSPHVIGSASPVGLWAIDLNCRLICYYPTGDVIDVDNEGRPHFTSKIYNYGIQNGFATVETNTISSYQTGLVVGVNPLLYNITTANGRPATQTELDMIENAIKEGVILPPVG